MGVAGERRGLPITVGQRSDHGHHDAGKHQLRRRLGAALSAGRAAAQHRLRDAPRLRPLHAHPPHQPARKSARLSERHVHDILFVSVCSSVTLSRLSVKHVHNILFVSVCSSVTLSRLSVKHVHNILFVSVCSSVTLSRLSVKHVHDILFCVRLFICHFKSVVSETCSRHPFLCPFVHLSL